MYGTSQVHLSRIATSWLRKNTRTLRGGFMRPNCSKISCSCIMQREAMYDSNTSGAPAYAQINCRWSFFFNDTRPASKTKKSTLPRCVESCGNVCVRANAADTRTLVDKHGQMYPAPRWWPCAYVNAMPLFFWRRGMYARGRELPKK